MLRNTIFTALMSLAILLLLGLPVFSKDKSPAKTTEKPKIAVLALEAKNIPAVYADIVRDILEVNLHKQGNFAVLERSQINLIMKEQKTTLNQCSETQCAVDYGKVLSADLVVVGSISRLTEYNIAVKLVDIRESRIIAAEFEQVPSDKELDRAVNNLAGRISRAAIKDTGYVPEPQDDDRHPVYFGIAYRYGMCFGFRTPYLSPPDNYEDPLKIKSLKDNRSVMGVGLSLDYFFNRYFSVKSNAVAYILGENPAFALQETRTYGADSIFTMTWHRKHNFSGMGLDIFGKASYPFKRIIPHIALGCGYTYFTYSKANALNYSFIIPSGDQYIYAQYRKNLNLFSLNAETGFTLLIQDSIGFTLSVIYSHALKQSIYQKPKYTVSSNGTLPAVYQNITSNPLKQVESMDLPPIYYIQAGFVFRFK